MKEYLFVGTVGLVVVFKEVEG